MKTKVLGVVGISLFALSLYMQQAYGSNGSTSQVCTAQANLAYEIMKARQSGISKEEINKAAPSGDGLKIADLAFEITEVHPSLIEKISVLFGDVIEDACYKSLTGVEV